MDNIEIDDKLMIGGCAASGALYSNKSSLSSSTSSLVSSYSTSTTPLVFAPPPTPLSSTLQNGQPHSTIPIYQLSQQSPISVNQQQQQQQQQLQQQLGSESLQGGFVEEPSSVTSMFFPSRLGKLGGSSSNRRECKVYT
jgi:hypothetical protein